MISQKTGRPRPDSKAFICLAKAALVVCAALITANCSSSSKLSSIDPKYGVKASPRVVEEGQPAPKGGGRAMIGKPYTIAGRTYVPRENPDYSREGLASWYGPSFHGRLTANGEVFDRASVSAAHPTMPLPSYARVTNLENGRSIIVRVNDRGPYHGNRTIDVSERAAHALDFKRMGTAPVRVEYVGRASLSGSDDRMLMASLTTDGSPARLQGSSSPVMLASAEPPRSAFSFAPVPEAAPAKADPIVTAALQEALEPEVPAQASATTAQDTTATPLPPSARPN